QEGGLVLVPRDDVDLLALQLVHHGLHAAAAHTDAGAHRVDGVVVGDDGDLRAAARVAGHGLDLDDAVVDLRHLHLEQFRHELRVGARQEDLRAAGFAPHVLDVAADAVADAIGLAADLLVPAQDALAPADVDDDVAVFLALDDPVDDAALAVLEFLELAVALGLAHLLQDHLLGALRGDAAQIDGGNLIHDLVADLRVGQVAFRLLDGQLGVVVLKFLVGNHGADAGKAGAAGLAVDLHPDVHFRAVAGLRGPGEAVLHRLDHQIRVDHLFPRHRLGGLQKLQL